MHTSQPDISNVYLLMEGRDENFPSCTFTLPSVNVIILNLMLAVEFAELKHVIFRKKQSCYGVVKIIISLLA